eukprot:g12705.t1
MATPLRALWIGGFWHIHPTSGGRRWADMSAEEEQQFEDNLHNHESLDPMTTPGDGAGDDRVAGDATDHILPAPPPTLKATLSGASADFAERRPAHSDDHGAPPAGSYSKGVQWVTLRRTRYVQPYYTREAPYLDYLLECGATELSSEDEDDLCRENNLGNPQWFDRRAWGSSESDPGDGREEEGALFGGDWNTILRGASSASPTETSANAPSPQTPPATQTSAQLCFGFAPSAGGAPWGAEEMEDRGKRSAQQAQRGYGGLSLSSGGGRQNQEGPPESARPAIQLDKFTGLPDETSGEVQTESMIPPTEVHSDESDDAQDPLERYWGEPEARELESFKEEMLQKQHHSRRPDVAEEAWRTGFRWLLPPRWNRRIDAFELHHQRRKNSWRKNPRVQAVLSKIKGMREEKPLGLSDWRPVEALVGLAKGLLFQCRKLSLSRGSAVGGRGFVDGETGKNTAHSSTTRSGLRTGTGRTREETAESPSGARDILKEAIYTDATMALVIVHLREFRDTHYAEVGSPAYNHLTKVLDELGRCVSDSF